MKSEHRRWSQFHCLVVDKPSSRTELACRKSRNLRLQRRRLLHVPTVWRIVRLVTKCLRNQLASDGLDMRRLFDLLSLTADRVRVAVDVDETRLMMCQLVDRGHDRSRLFQFDLFIEKRRRLFLRLESRCVGHEFSAVRRLQASSRQVG